MQDRPSSGVGTTPDAAASAPTILALALLLGVAGLFFAPVLAGRSFSTVAGHHLGVYPWKAFGPEFADYPQNDQADLSYPWQAFVDRTLRAGSFPLWNPGSFGGQPFFANGSSAVLYPPRLLASALPLPWAHDFLSFFHLLLSGWGMWFLLRELRLGPAGALLGGTAWMLCPFNTAWLHLEVVAPAAAWLPLSLALVHRAIDRRSWRAAVAASVTLACALVSGHLLFMALVHGVAASYGLVLVLARRFADGGAGLRRRVAMLGLIAIGPLALAGAVFVPTAVFLHGLGREPLPYETVRALVRVPYAVFASLLRPPSLPPVTELHLHEMAYVGRVVAVLAVVGFFAPGRAAWLGRALAIGTFLVATDTLVLRWIYAVLPQFSFFAPLGRILNFFDFGVVLLGAAGLDVIVRWTRGASPSRWTAPQRSALARAGLVMAALVVALSTGELLRFARRVNPPFPPRASRYSYPETPLIRVLAAELSTGHNGPGRMLAVRTPQISPVLWAAESLVFGFENAGGYDSTVPGRSETLWRVLGGEPIENVIGNRHRRAFTASFDAYATRLELLARFGVTTLVTPPELGDDPRWQQRCRDLGLRNVYRGIDGSVYRLPDAEGGPEIVAREALASDAESALRRVLAPDFDDDRRVVLEADAVPPDLRQHGVRDGGGWARVVAKGVNQERIDVHAAGEAWLLIPTSWDGGWRGWVSGREVPVVRANYAFQAVPVPAGDSRVDLVYRPRGLAAGVALSAVALGGLAILFARGGPRRPAGARA